MRPGQQRKRMLKLARRVPVEQVEGFVLRAPDPHPCYFVLHEHGNESLCCWHAVYGDEVSMQDEVFHQACCEYLKDRGLVFESAASAAAYARARGLLENRT